VPQLAWIKAADVFNVTFVGPDPAAEKAAYNLGLIAAQAAVSAIPRRT
jgi:hypothetical protein